MQGLISTSHHIIPMLVIYLIVIFAVVLVRRQILKNYPSLVKLTIRISKVIFGVLTLGIILIIIIVLGFLSNPFEREQIKTISTATIDQEFKDAKSNEITEINKEVVNRSHIEKEIEATKDNQKALEDSKNIFKDTEDL